MTDSAMKSSTFVHAINKWNLLLLYTL